MPMLCIYILPATLVLYIWLLNLLLFEVFALKGLAELPCRRGNMPWSRVFSILCTNSEGEWLTNHLGISNPPLTPLTLQWCPFQILITFHLHTGDLPSSPNIPNHNFIVIGIPSYGELYSSFFLAWYPTKSDPLVCHLSPLC